MKIHKYGVVILTEGQPIRVEDWLIEREPDDPADATNEQLLLGFAIHWAKQKFDAAYNSAAMDVFRKLAKTKKSVACDCTEAATHSDPHHLKTGCVAEKAN